MYSSQPLNLSLHLFPFGNHKFGFYVYGSVLWISSFVLFFNSTYKWYDMSFSLWLAIAATSMDLEIIRLSKISQIKKDKYHMISLIYGIKQRRYTSTCLLNVGVLNSTESSGSQMEQLYNIRTQCSLSPLGVHYLHPVSRTEGAAKHPTMHRTLPITKTF